MTIIKEFREFFVRNVKVPTGTKKDQEINFATQYTAVLDGVSKTVYNRFLKDNYPSEDVFKKLFESITFKLNIEDTATSSQQGLVEIATDNEVILGTNTSAGYQLTPKPSQVLYLKTANALPSSAGNFKVGDIYLIVLITSVDFGKLYVCTNATTPTFSLLGVTHPIPSGGTAGQVLEKINSTNFNTQWATPAFPNGTTCAMIYISQASTSAPTATEIVNTIGTFVYGYTSAGTYSITCTGKFLAAKTFIKFSGLPRNGGILDVVRISDDALTITTLDAAGGTPTDAILATDWIEIIIIP